MPGLVSRSQLQALGVSRGLELPFWSDAANTTSGLRSRVWTFSGPEPLGQTP